MPILKPTSTRPIAVPRLLNELRSQRPVNVPRAPTSADGFGTAASHDAEHQLSPQAPSATVRFPAVELWPREAAAEVALPVSQFAGTVLEPAVQSLLTQQTRGDVLESRTLEHVKEQNGFSFDSQFPGAFEALETAFRAATPRLSPPPVVEHAVFSSPNLEITAKVRNEDDGITTQQRLSYELKTKPNALITWSHGADTPARTLRADASGAATIALDDDTHRTVEVSVRDRETRQLLQQAFVDVTYGT